MSAEDQAVKHPLSHPPHSVAHRRKVAAVVFWIVMSYCRSLCASGSCAIQKDTSREGDKLLCTPWLQTSVLGKQRFGFALLVTRRCEARRRQARATLQCRWVEKNKAPVPLSAPLQLADFGSSSERRTRFQFHPCHAALFLLELPYSGFLFRTSKCSAAVPIFRILHRSLNSHVGPWCGCSCSR